MERNDVGESIDTSGIDPAHFAERRVGNRRIEHGHILGEVIGPVEERRGPLKANAARLRDLLAGRTKRDELPPWLVVGDRVVMRWRDWHHVAPIGGDDPMAVAERLFNRLRAVSHRAARAG